MLIVLQGRASCLPLVDVFPCTFLIFAAMDDERWRYLWNVNSSSGRHGDGRLRRDLIVADGLSESRKGPRGSLRRWVDTLI